MNGLVFDIQHFSIFDGPGIRTTVFMKGCSLDCAWCHNPESISPKKEIQTYFFKCIGCGQCFEVCPQHAHIITDDGRLYDRDLCIQCGICTDSCYSGALVMTGSEMSVNDIVDEVSRDISFYKDSGGGVTVSGGEPLLQAEFVKNLLVELKKTEIHTAIDTAGNIPFSAIEKVLPHTDLFLYDIKAMDSDIHKKFTGVGNSRILKNLSRLSRFGIPIRIRIPVIPDVNAKLDEIEKIAVYISKLENIEAVEPLAYHSLGAGKLESMGAEGKRPVFKVPKRKVMVEIYELFETYGLKVIRKSN
ncbi:MAG: glycyl-radical enzyme activating protein [Clostridiales bacterium]|nr:glycyl-radical enzyme activating protein [Clostridiales bacterium]